MAIGSSRKSDAGNDEKKMKGLQPTDLVIPGASILILMILTLFVYIPSITDAGKMNREIEEVKGKQEILQRNLDAIQPLIDDEVKLQRDLRKTKQIIPTKLDVGDFSYYVNKLAIDSGLVFKDLSASSRSQTTEDARALRNPNVQSYVSNVTGPILYEGTFSEIVDFLDQLQRRSPYIIEARTLKMNKRTRGDSAVTSPDDEIWEVELNITGYYIERESPISVTQLYHPIQPYTRFPQFLEIFEFKSEILESAR